MQYHLLSSIEYIARCQMHVPPNSEHCQDCGLCVQNRDHHCKYN